MVGNWIKRLKANKRRIGVGVLAVFLAGFMGMSLLSNNVTSYAQTVTPDTVVDPDTSNVWSEVAANSNSTENIGRIWTDKSVFDKNYKFSGDLEDTEVKKGEKANFLVALSAMASTSNLKSTTTTTTPLDIVLVLDTSGSMGAGQSEVVGHEEVYNLDTSEEYVIIVDGSYQEVDYSSRYGWYYRTWWETYYVTPKESAEDDDTSHVQFYNPLYKIDALQNAANAFIDSAADVNANQPEENKDLIRISLVKFSGDRTYNIGNDTGRTQIVSDFSNDANTLKNEVDSFVASGVTSADYGLNLAQMVIDGDSRHGLQGARENAQKVVVFFTDGQPCHSGSTFQSKVANDAIEEAGNLKENNVKLYSVGMFSEANPDDLNANFNRYMHGVSSNYPDATSYSNLGNRISNSDYYKSANDSQELNEIFASIFDESTDNIDSGSPIEEVTSGGGAENTPGYLTFTDTLGSYMEVTGAGENNDTMYLAFADGLHEGKTNDGGQTQTWKFSGKVDGGGVNSVYPDGADLSTIEVKVEKSDDLAIGDTITVRIPASLIPMRNYSVDTDDETMTISNTYPVRLFYGVSLKEAAEDALNDPQDENYKKLVNSQTSEDKKTIEFYSNSFTKGANEGNTTATFTPNESNKFYYYPVNTQLFVDKSCETPATNQYIESVDTLYYKESHWELTGTGDKAQEIEKVYSISRTGNDWSNIVQRSGNYYIDDHAMRADRPGTLVSNKTDNLTVTADAVLSPAWEGINVSQKLGNNGKLSYPAPGQLEIKKTVEWGNASDDTKKEKNNFKFVVNLYTETQNEETGETEKDKLTGEYSYNVYGAGEQPVSSGLVEDGGEIQLSDGQRVVISDLPNDAKYTVTETGANMNGFTTTDSSELEENQKDGTVEGSIVGGLQQSVSFTNTYNAKEINLGDSNRFKVEKVLENRDWRSTDVFKFELQNINGSPMPSAENVETIEISESDLDQETNLYTKLFSDITFTKPGTYRYRISEDGDSNPIIGINYSDAVYRATVTVVDDGLGALKVESVKVELMNDDNGNSHVTENNGEYIGELDDDGIMTFTNKYEASTNSIGIQGIKEYNDTTSGGNGITASKFTFQLEALGGYNSNAVDSTLTIAADNVPMPSGAEGNKITASNVGNGFTFASIPFDGNDVGNTYVYEVSEIEGEEIGMNYDKTKYTVEIRVTEEGDPENPGHYHIVPTILGDEARPQNVKFNNTYDPTDVTISTTTGDAIHGSKILDGRQMLENEVFYFQLTQKSGPENVLDNPETVEVTQGSGMDFSFSDLTFSKVGEYTFIVNEVADLSGTETTDGQGMTYSQNKAIVTVKVTLENGALKANVTYSNEDSEDISKAVFKNVYKSNMNYGAEGKGGIQVTKQLLDRPMANGEFKFTINGEGEAADMVVDADKNFENTAAATDQTITMKKLQGLKFDQDDAGKTYTFIVDEVEPSEGELSNVVYDKSRYQVDIEVVDNGNGTMHTLTTVTQIKDKNGTDTNTVIIDKANSDEDGYQVPTFGFVNDYNPNAVSVGEDADNALQVTKKVTGADSADDYTFTLTATGDNVGDIQGLDENHQTTVTTSGTIEDGKTQTLSFNTLTFTEPGTYTFNVAENAPQSDEGWTFDANTYTITVEVSNINEDGQYDGNLYINNVNGNNPTFTNKYKASSITTGTDTLESLQITKAVSGAPATEEFNFALTPKEDYGDKVEGLTDGKLEASTTDLKGKEESQTLTFGQLTFKAEGEYVFNVEETNEDPAADSGWTYDNDASKQVTVKVTDTDKDGKLEATVEGNNPTFTNSYKAGAVTGIPTDFSLEKIFKGHEWTEDYSFQFKLTPANENTPMPLNDIVTVSAPDKGSEDTATFNFGEIEYTQTGTYTYTVNEVKGDNAGVTYDEHSAKITVNVTDGKTGKLSAVATIENGVFTNTYDTGSVNYDTSVGLDIVKNMTGRAIGEGDFSFTMTGADDASVARLNDGKALTFSTNGAALNGNNATETINAITHLTFTKKDAGKTYTYTVKENVPNDAKENVLNGVTYDSKEYTIVFEVTEDGKGTLSVETFVDGVSQGITTGSVNAKATPVQLVFNNSYDAGSIVVGASGSATIQAKKVLVNGLIGNYAGAFQFNVTGTNNAIVSTGTNDASGAITFSDIQYTTENLNAAVSEAGSNQVGKATVDRTGDSDVYTFKYTVSEVNSGLDGITITNGSFDVTVTVTDNRLGHLSAAVTYDTGNSLTFVNTYGYGESAEINLKGNKVISAREGLNPPALTGGEYQFTITGSEGAPLPQTTTVSNAGSNVSFGPITYTMENVFGSEQAVENPTTEEMVEGETSEEPKQEAVEQSKVRTKNFLYTITESGSLPGVINDASAKMIKVTVTDHGDGTISAVITEQATGAVSGNDFTFINTYNVTPTNPTSPTDGFVNIKKELKGQNLDEGEFTFQMKDTAGNVVSEATNDAEGNVVFAGITFDTPGIYSYSISELNTGINGFTYDTSVYNAVATVTDHGDGTLKVEWSVTKDQKAVDSIVFKNTYAPITSANVQLGAIKKLEGKELSDGQFTFELKDEEGNVVSKATNNEKGMINFESVDFDKAGSYSYTLSEANDGQEGIQYDESIYDIVIHVEDDQQGHLVVTTCDITKDGEAQEAVIFTNEYQENEQPGNGGQEDLGQNKDGSDTAAKTGAGLFISLIGSAVSLMGILLVWRKRSI